MDPKPVVVAAAFTAPGHSGGPVQICLHFARKGYKVYGIFGPEFKAAIKGSEIEYVENTYRPDPAYMQMRSSIADPVQRMMSDMRHVFGASTPGSYHLLKETLERAREENPARPVVILHEMLYQGAVPFYYGAPLPRGYDSFPPLINWCTSNNIGTDYSVPPFGLGLPYDPTEENIARWRSIYDSMKPLQQQMNEYHNSVLKSLGATREITGWLLDVFNELGDVTLFPTSISTEYPRSSTGDKKFVYIGGLPLKPLSPDFTYPVWWPTIIENAALPADSSKKKKVLFVTQGTVSLNYDHLLIPTIRALAGRKDCIVVATLGVRGQALSQERLGMSIPENTIVVDYLPYDVLLPHVDVFVSNGGYNGFMHGVMNGVPMVLAGTGEDKAEVSGRAEYAGVAVNLRVNVPTEEQIGEGVERILNDRTYKGKAMALKKENEDMDSLGAVERIIDQLAKTSAL
jgi:UDP:flavonoid glycosyltransferase YjiC (YdhE family)